MLFLSKCAKKLDEGLDFPNSCFKGFFLCLNHHFFFSAIVLIYKVGLSEMFTSDAEKKKKQNKIQGWI